VLFESPPVNLVINSDPDSAWDQTHPKHVPHDPTTSLRSNDRSHGSGRYGVPLFRRNGCAAVHMVNAALYPRPTEKIHALPVNVIGHHGAGFLRCPGLRLFGLRWRRPTSPLMHYAPVPEPFGEGRKGEDRHQSDDIIYFRGQDRQKSEIFHPTECQTARQEHQEIPARAVPAPENHEAEAQEVYQKGNDESDGGAGLRADAEHLMQDNRQTHRNPCAHRSRQAEPYELGQEIVRRPDEQKQAPRRKIAPLTDGPRNRVLRPRLTCIFGHARCNKVVSSGYGRQAVNPRVRMAFSGVSAMARR